MIVTVTPNPSIDRTVTLDGPLVRGAVHRLTSVISEPGGKGINVARALHYADVDALALLPARDHDPLLAAMDEHGLRRATVPAPGAVRTNTAVTEPDGTTTKLNEAGFVLSDDDTRALTSLVVEHAMGAGWVVMSGSLPPGLPAEWYAATIDALRASGSAARVAIDTSDAPLAALSARLPGSAPDLMKPNSEELAQLIGRGDGVELETAAERGDIAPVVEAAAALRERGVAEVLVTLGGAGAVLAAAEGVWHATAPRITVVSTVGAGDSSLAGYVSAAEAGLPHPERLRRAVAYGSVAASLPGTDLPRPDQAAALADGITITQL
ncbi:1-phosphofructokinase family hexose kinase [Actinomycetota bacterium]